MTKELTLTDLLVEKAEKEEKYFKNYLKYAKKIKEEAQKILGEVKVFVFGSILKEDEIPQDIDILIISKGLTDSSKKTRARGELWRRIGIFSPFEFHFSSPEEYEQWWKYFLKEKIEI